MGDRIPEQDVIKPAPIEEDGKVRVQRPLRKAAGEHVLPVDEEIALLQAGTRLGEYLLGASEAVQPVHGLGRQAVTADLVARELRFIQQQRRDSRLGEQAGGAAPAGATSHNDDVIVHDGRLRAC